MTGWMRAEIDFLVDPRTPPRFCSKTADDGSVLCLATHDRPKPVTALDALRGIGGDRTCDAPGDRRRLERVRRVVGR